MDTLGRSVAALPIFFLTSDITLTRPMLPDASGDGPRFQPGRSVSASDIALVIDFVTEHRIFSATLNQ
jgi:hypothetical protein